MGKNKDIGVTINHNMTLARGDNDCHPTSAITGLNAVITVVNSAYQKPGLGIPSSDFAAAAQASLALANTAYQKPAPGIPFADTTVSVQGSLTKADSAYQKPAAGIPFSDIKKGFACVTDPKYGAVGDGVADDTLAFQTAINDVAVSTLFIPKGYYKVYGVGTEIFTINRAIQIFGEGKQSSFIELASATPATTDLFKIKGSIQDLHFHDFGCVREGAGLTVGRHMIYIDLTTAGHYLSGSKFSRLYFDPSAGSSIKLDNPTNADGFFTSAIEECLIYGGLDLTRSGDSISIVRNKIGLTKTGIKITTVPGAMRTFISENNITTSDGAIILTNADQISIKNNQFESIGAPVIQTSLITVDGGNNITIEENNLDTLGSIPNCININNTLKCTIDKNSLHTANPNSHIIVGSGAKDSYIGYKNVSRVDGVVKENLVITNAGIGTTNIDVPLTLLNGWVASDSANKGVPRCHKTFDGTVFIKGELKSGTAARYTSLFVLPEGFRPKVATMCQCASQSSDGVYVLGVVVIDTSGNCMIDTGSNFLLNPNSISFKANSILA